jgi:DNA-binding transcriptional MerR regulator
MDKSPDAFRTISEVADELDLPQHVLRFWETRFNQIRPLKRGGGRRYYRPDDVDLLRGIRHLLYGQGYTIKGVQRILKEDGIRVVQGIGRGEESLLPPAEASGHAPGEEDADDGDAPSFASQDGDVARISREARGRDRSGGPISPDDIARLEAALEELAECERVLASLKNREDMASR